MIFQALYEYAERENLGDSDFEDVEIKWLIRINRKGDFVGLEGLSGKTDGKRERGKEYEVPYNKDGGFNSGGKAHFLYDNFDRLILLSFEKWNADKKENMKESRKTFIHQIKTAADVVKKINLNAVETFLTNKDDVEKLKKEIIRQKAKGSHNATFAIGDQVILESGDLKKYWRNLRTEEKSRNKRSKSFTCLITGDATEGCEKAGAVRLPGGQSSGSPLISAYEDAFMSFGLDGSLNSAVSENAEVKVRKALKKLLSQGEYKKEYGFIWWTKEKVDFNPFDLLNEADTEKISELMKSVYKGEKKSELKSNLFYAMSLSGNGGRLMVRDWIEQKLEETQKSISEWFQDLSLLDFEGKQVYPRLRWGLLKALTPSGVKKSDFNKIDELPPQYFSGLAFAAFSGGPIPFGIYAAACRRQQLEEEKMDSRRMALIKIFLLRCQSKNKEVNSMMTESLNKNLRDPAYLCGRLFAVLSRLQDYALGKRNAGVVERFYASACTTPALVMGRLFRNAQYHLAKLKQEKPGAAVNVEKDFELLSEALGNAWPATLDLEGQGRFALGYYHQKAENFRAYQENKNYEEEGK